MVHLILICPLANTEDDVQVIHLAYPESVVEMDKDILGVAKEFLYEGFIDTEEAILESGVQASL